MAVYRVPKSRPETLLDSDLGPSEDEVAQFYGLLATGDVAAVSEWLDRTGASRRLVNTDGRSLAGQTPLHVVLREPESRVPFARKESLALYLIGAGFMIDYPDEDGRRPLHLAAALGSEKIVQRLLAEGVATDARDSYGNLPLHYSVMGTATDCPRTEVGALGRQDTLQTVNANLRVDRLRQAVTESMIGDAQVLALLRQVYGLLQSAPNLLPEELTSRLQSGMDKMETEILDRKALLDGDRRLDVASRLQTLLGESVDQIARQVYGESQSSDYIQLGEDLGDPRAERELRTQRQRLYDQALSGSRHDLFNLPDLEEAFTGTLANLLETYQASGNAPKLTAGLAWAMAWRAYTISWATWYSEAMVEQAGTLDTLANGPYPGNLDALLQALGADDWLAPLEHLRPYLAAVGEPNPPLAQRTGRLLSPLNAASVPTTRDNCLTALATRNLARYPHLADLDWSYLDPSQTLLQLADGVASRLPYPSAWMSDTYYTELDALVQREDLTPEVADLEGPGQAIAWLLGVRGDPGPTVGPLIGGAAPAQRWTILATAPPPPIAGALTAAAQSAYGVPPPPPRDPLAAYGGLWDLLSVLLPGRGINTAPGRLNPAAPLGEPLSSLELKLEQAQAALVPPTPRQIRDWERTVYDRYGAFDVSGAVNATYKGAPIANLLAIEQTLFQNTILQRATLGGQFLPPNVGSLSMLLEWFDGWIYQRGAAGGLPWDPIPPTHVPHTNSAGGNAAVPLPATLANAGITTATLLARLPVYRDLDRWLSDPAQAYRAPTALALAPIGGGANVAARGVDLPQAAYIPALGLADADQMLETYALWTGRILDVFATLDQGRARLVRQLREVRYDPPLANLKRNLGALRQLDLDGGHGPQLAVAIYYSIWMVRQLTGYLGPLSGVMVGPLAAAFGLAPPAPGAFLPAFYTLQRTVQDPIYQRMVILYLLTLSRTVIDLNAHPIDLITPDPAIPAVLQDVPANAPMLQVEGGAQLAIPVWTSDVPLWGPQMVPLLWHQVRGLVEVLYGGLYADPQYALRTLHLTLDAERLIVSRYLRGWALEYLGRYIQGWPKHPGSHHLPLRDPNLRWLGYWDLVGYLEELQEAVESPESGLPARIPGRYPNTWFRPYTQWSNPLPPLPLLGERAARDRALAHSLLQIVRTDLRHRLVQTTAGWWGDVRQQIVANLAAAPVPPEALPLQVWVEDVLRGPTVWNLFQASVSDNIDRGAAHDAALDVPLWTTGPFHGWLAVEPGREVVPLLAELITQSVAGVPMLPSDYLDNNIANLFDTGEGEVGRPVLLDLEPSLRAWLASDEGRYIYNQLPRKTSGEADVSLFSELAAIGGRNIGRTGFAKLQKAHGLYRRASTGTSHTLHNEDPYPLAALYLPALALALYRMATALQQSMGAVRILELASSTRPSGGPAPDRTQIQGLRTLIDRTYDSLRGGVVYHNRLVQLAAVWSVERILAGGQGAFTDQLATLPNLPSLEDAEGLATWLTEYRQTRPVIYHGRGGVPPNVVQNSPWEGIHWESAYRGGVERVLDPQVGRRVTLDTEPPLAGFGGLPAAGPAIIGYRVAPLDLINNPPILAASSGRILAILKHQIVDRVDQIATPEMWTILAGDQVAIGAPARTPAGTWAVRRTADDVVNDYIRHKLRDVLAHHFIGGPRPRPELLVYLPQVTAEYRLRGSTLDLVTVALRDQRNADFALPGVYPKPQLDTGGRLLRYLYRGDWLGQGERGERGSCYYINPRVAELLVPEGGLYRQNQEGRTALHLAVLAGDQSLVRTLAAAGASLDGPVDIYGQTPQTLAITEMQTLAAAGTGETVRDALSLIAEPVVALLHRGLETVPQAGNQLLHLAELPYYALCIYNHQLGSYLRDYRYGFTWEMVQALQVKVPDLQTHPNDLWDLDAPTLAKVWQATVPREQVVEVVTEDGQREARELRARRDSYRAEWEATGDPEAGQRYQQTRTELAALRTQIQTEAASVPRRRRQPPSLARWQREVTQVGPTLPRGILPTDWYRGVAGGARIPDPVLPEIWSSYLARPLLLSPGMVIARLCTALTDPPLPGVLSSLAPYLHTLGEHLREHQTGALVSDPVADLTVYLLQTMVTTPLRRVIYRYLYQKMQSVADGRLVPADLMAAIREAAVDGKTIAQYLADDLPALAYQYYSGEYQGLADPARRVADERSLWSPITLIASRNRLYPLSSETRVQTDLLEDLYPWLENSYRQAIHHVRMAVYNYQTYLLTLIERALVAEQLTR